ncbi:Zinc finger BED domain-containing protein 1 [Ceratobasidium sp. 394]|nr:Zinc finger BED domain-containing protein 1 [Ceratobasidium sp. 394]
MLVKKSYSSTSINQPTIQSITTLQQMSTLQIDPICIFIYSPLSVLDPRFKESLFTSGGPLTTELFSDSWVDDCANALRDTCNEFYNVTEPTSSTESTEAPQAEELDVWDDFSRAWRAQLPACAFEAPASSSLSAEIAAYLKEGLTTMALLAWWRLNAHRFPRLAAMARDFLCIPGTSVAVERVFSAGRDLIGVRRASLSAETIRMLMTYRAGIMLEKGVSGGSGSSETLSVS